LFHAQFIALGVKEALRKMSAERFATCPAKALSLAWIGKRSLFNPLAPF
jgi:hypothetical protein